METKPFEKGEVEKKNPQRCFAPGFSCVSVGWEALAAAFLGGGDIAAYKGSYSLKPL